ncbi:MAG TPA: glycosyltransferase family 39 protein, partial [Actinomycetota bacterium]|nr:glycosyltransferase family 39 protein [Actinomycetota bacterium]
MDTTDRIPAPEHDAPRLTRQIRLDLLTGGLVLLVYAVAQLWLLLGPHPYDPAYYFRTALEFPIASADYWTLRIGLMAPVSLAVRVFGPSEAGLYAVPLAVGLLLTGAVYGTMLALFRDRVVGAVAALVTALNPSYLLNSSFIFPDTAATATFTAGIFFLVLGRGRPEERDAGWIATVCALAAGVFFGWSYLIREFSPILLPAVAVAVVLLRYPLRRLGLVLGAAFLTFSVELLYGIVGYRDPFVRTHVLLDRRDAAVRPTRERLMELIQDKLDDPLDTILIFPRLLLTWNVGWAFVVLLG